MDRNAIKEMIERYLAGKSPARESAWLETWYNRQARQGTSLSKDDLEQGQQLMQNKLDRHVGTAPSSSRYPWIRIAAAAIVLIALSFGIYFYVADYSNLKSTIVDRKSNDIDPGGNRAVLTLADGRKIVLDEAANGELAEESGIRITKTADGQLVYEILRHAPQARASEGQPKAGVAGGGDRESTGVRQLADAPTYNTITTPRGGQYKIILPDSSVVWLNAASSLRYPTRFAGAERRVELTGEAFFSVRHQTSDIRHKTSDTRHQTQDIRHETANAQASSPSNGARSLSDYWRMSRVPFIVATATQEVTVLGTQFNINAYEDEATVKTTLLEGAVSVRVASTSDKSTNQPINQSTNKSTTLRPNQQSVLSGHSLAVVDVDPEDVVAWKNGWFIFNNSSLRNVMQQISRWYDVEVDFNGLPDRKLYGEIERSVKLSQVLQMLEKTSGIKFKLEGGKLMVVSDKL